MIEQELRKKRNNNRERLGRRERAKSIRNIVECD